MIYLQERGLSIQFTWRPQCKALPLPTGVCTDYHDWNLLNLQNSISQAVQQVQTAPQFYLALSRTPRTQRPGASGLDAALQLNLTAEVGSHSIALAFDILQPQNGSGCKGP